MRIGICSDHAGVEYKGRIISYLLSKGHSVENFGTDCTDSCDYPDFANALSKAVSDKVVDCGITICGTGNGMAITCNKHEGVRAGLAWNTEVAALVKRHNNANVLAIPARFVSARMAVMMTKAWLEAKFEGGRHQRRLDKLPR